MIQYIVDVWKLIKWVLVKKKHREYRVVRCPYMPSTVNMKCFGKPKAGQDIYFHGRRKDGYRLVKPATVKTKRGKFPKRGGNVEIYTPFGFIFAKRIK